MQNDYVAPINHSTGGAVAKTTAGAAGGAVKGAITGWLGSMAGFIAVGALIGFAIGTGGAGTIFTGSVLGPVIGGVAGGLVGWIPSQFIGGASGLFGAFTGGSKAANKVGQERGAAAELSAQIEMARAQAPAMGPQTVVLAPSASNDSMFPARGSALNQTMPGRVGNIQHMGLAASPQLAQGIA